MINVETEYSELSLFLKENNVHIPSKDNDLDIYEMIEQVFELNNQFGSLGVLEFFFESMDCLIQYHVRLFLIFCVFLFYYLIINFQIEAP